MIGQLQAFPYLHTLLVAFGVSLCLTGGIRLLALRIGVLDKPHAHKQHEQATPTLGGLAVFAGFTLAVLLHCSLDRSLSSILVAGVLMVAVGLLDDLFDVRATIKLLALAVASAILVFYGDVTLRLGLGILGGAVMTFLWLGFVSSAFNGLDNADGAAGGVTVIAASFAFLIAWGTWQPNLAVVAIALAGSAAGFLCWNFPAPHARIFLGDSGSFFLGFVLAAMLILGEWSPIPAVSVAVALTLLTVPLFDFVLILLLRGLRGLYRDLRDPITMCARDHTYHRLVAYGLSKREAVLVLYLFAILSGSISLAILSTEAPTAGWWFLALLGAWALGLTVLERAPLDESVVYAHVKPTSPDEASVPELKGSVLPEVGRS